MLLYREALMKRIMDGLRYDTEAAEEIAHWGNGKPSGDFDQCSETLYRTPNGRYFLLGEGGPQTRWKSEVPTGGWE